MEFMHLQPHAQMPDDDTTSDYGYDLLDRISVYNADYVNKTSVCIKYMRSHLITADASSAYIARCDPWGLSDPAKHTAIGDLHPSRNSICKVIDAPPWSTYPSVL